VLVTRLRAFEALGAHLEPRRVVALLQEFVGAVTDVAVAQRAVIDLVSGDTVRLLYGVPTPRRDDPVRAVRAAAALQRTVLALRNRWLSAGDHAAGTLALAVGVASGEVVWADLIGRGGHVGIPVGEPVSRAERLCAAAQGGETLVDEATCASAATRLDGDFVFTARSANRGRTDMRGVYRVQARRAGLRVVPRRVVGGRLSG
jgi:class 3 adenylate cyclase